MLPDTRVEVVGTTGGANTHRILRPQTRALSEAVLVVLEDDSDNTQPVLMPDAPPPMAPLSTVIRQRGYLQRIRHRWEGSPLSDWTRPHTVTLATWPASAPPQPHTIRRWMRRRTHQAFVVGAVSIVAGVFVCYVLVASLVVAVLADAFLMGAALIGGGQ
jgi:hypothetical protein